MSFILLYCNRIRIILSEFFVYFGLGFVEYLPSKKLILIMLVAIILGGGFIVLKNIYVLDTSPSVHGGLEIVETQSLQKIDTDADGLYDWEEALLGTDPLNPDSDDDGIFDGEHFNAQKQYSDLSAGNLQALYSLKNNTRAVPENITDTLFREASAQYGFLGEGNAIDDTAKQQIVNSLARDIPLPELEKPYTVQKISLASDTSPETVRAYASQLLLAFRAQEIMYAIDPLPLIQEWLAENNESSLNQIETLINAYTKLTDTLARITTPKNLGVTHVELLNNLHGTSAVLSTMIEANYDPIKSMLAVAHYIMLRGERQQIISPLTSYFEDIALR